MLKRLINCQRIFKKGGAYIMEEKILLEKIEKEQKQLIQEKFLEQKHKQSLSSSVSASIDKLKAGEDKPFKKINVFSSSAFKSAEPLKREIKTESEQTQTIAQADTLQNKSSQTIETPNYDFIETLSDEQREKVFVFPEEKVETAPKVKKFKLKYIIISILFALFGVWGIVNIALLDQISTQYSVNLVTYLNNLHNLDATNSQNMENLFQTIPDQSLPPSTIGEKSNWFDRFCNFLSGLFGG